MKSITDIRMCVYLMKQSLAPNKIVVQEFGQQRFG